MMDFSNPVSSTVSMSSQFDAWYIKESQLEPTFHSSNFQRRISLAKIHNLYAYKKEENTLHYSFFIKRNIS